MSPHTGNTELKKNVQYWFLDDFREKKMSKLCGSLNTLSTTTCLSTGLNETLIIVMNINYDRRTGVR